MQLQVFLQVGRKGRSHTEEGGLGSESEGEDGTLLALEMEGGGYETRKTALYR